ncbi:MAG: hypothetical protein HQK76_07825 [Desulfobacterales bacterium]|nr:hypothetical protein [Desulfobacterales bacterium]
MELTIGGIITNGIQRGIQNLIPILINAVLWIITIWIPYLNVGTTIGMLTGVVPKMAKGESVSPTEIFNPVYRKRMGEFFLVMGFMFAGIMVGLLFFIIPGYVIFIAWMLAPLLVVDKEMNPIDAISTSNALTYGKKWTIFFGMGILIFVTEIVVFVAIYITGSIFDSLGNFGSIIILIVSIGGFALLMSIAMSALSYIYGTLVR